MSGGNLVLENFGGIAPKLGGSTIPDNYAQIAINSKVWSGELRPFYGILMQTQLPKTGTVQSMYLYNANTAWLCWTQDVNAARSPISGDTLEKLIYTGTDKPRITTNALYNAGTPGTSVPPNSYILGLPNPTNAPTAALGAAGLPNGNTAYVYTYVRKWSNGTIDESGPSAATAVINPANQHVTVTFNDAGAYVFTDYGITHRRVYRVAVGTTGAPYLYVGEVAIAATTLDDNVLSTNLGAAITTTAYLPPPDNAIGVVALPNGVLAMFAGNTLYLSDPYNPHAYPASNQYTVDKNIVSIGFFGNTVVVATQGRPWLFNGQLPSTMAGRKLPHRQPCISKRSLVSNDLGVTYATPDGLFQINANGASLITRDKISKDEWALFFPSTIHAASLDGRYVGFFQSGTNTDGTYQGGGFQWNQRDDAIGELTTFNFYVYGTFVVEETDVMYVIQQNPFNNNASYASLWESSVGTQYPYIWRSKVFLRRENTNFGAAAIDGTFLQSPTSAQLNLFATEQALIKAANQAQLASAKGGGFNDPQWNVIQWNGSSTLQNYPTQVQPATTVDFKLYVDGLLRFERECTDTNPFLLPSNYQGIAHEIELSSLVPIKRVTLAPSIEELAAT